MYGDLGVRGAPAFAVGDRVRISKYKRKTFDKGYTPNWTEEVFTIDKIQMTHPITYKVRDGNGPFLFYDNKLSNCPLSLVAASHKLCNALFTEKSCKRQSKRFIE